jgi:hypothetical protein
MSGIYQLHVDSGSVSSPSAGRTLISINESGELFTKDSSGNVTVYGSGSGGGSPFPFTGSADISGSLNIDFTETLQFFSDDDFSAAFGSAYLGPPLNWVDVTISGDFMGTVLTETNHTLYNITGDGQANIPSIGLSFPVDATGNILTVTGGSMSGSTLTNLLTYTDQTGLSLPELYTNQNSMVYVDPVSGDKTQFVFNQVFDSTGADMSFSKQNNAGENIALFVNDSSTGFMVSSGLSDLDAQIFDITNSNSDKVLEVTGNNIASDTILAHNYADDAAASGSGVPIGGIYHNSGSIRIRLT